MRKLSIKLKITIWFTLFMIILAFTILACLILVSRNTSSSEIKNLLIHVVDSNSKEVEYDDGELDIDDDYVTSKNAVSSNIFDDKGVQIKGYIDYPEIINEPFIDGVLKTITIGDDNFFVYDRLISSEEGPDIWVRGFVQENSNIIMASVLYKVLFILFPLLIILASLGGYFITLHAFKPINKISQMAKEIEKSGDLSKRIELIHNKDEIYNLSVTFNNMFKQLERNFEAERNFTSDASHELRTPVTIILAQCEYAFENATNMDELYEAIGAIQKQGYRMSRLIESLLQFTRIEQNIETKDFQIVNLSQIVKGLLKDYKPLNIKNISIEENIDDDISINADISLITRLVQNLIQNAYRYGKESGYIQVSLNYKETVVILSVSDNGIGITEEELPNIWNRFYRVDKARSNGNGMGLGLSMVKQIAEIHNGKVEVESTIGEGSTFRVLFYKK